MSAARSILDDQEPENVFLPEIRKNRWAGECSLIEGASRLRSPLTYIPPLSDAPDLNREVVEALERRQPEAVAFATEEALREIFSIYSHFDELKNLNLIHRIKAVLLEEMRALVKDWDSLP